jgi:hypothetical protein
MDEKENFITVGPKATKEDIEKLLKQAELEGHTRNTVIVEEEEYYKISTYNSVLEEEYYKISNYNSALELAHKYGMPRREKKRPDVDIVEEFKLIQQKKSNLSRSDRSWVVREFNKNYKLKDKKY